MKQTILAVLFGVLLGLVLILFMRMCSTDEPEPTGLDDLIEGRTRGALANAEDARRLAVSGDSLRAGWEAFARAKESFRLEAIASERRIVERASNEADRAFVESPTLSTCTYALTSCQTLRGVLTVQVDSLRAYTTNLEGQNEILVAEADTLRLGLSYSLASFSLFEDALELRSVQVAGLRGRVRSLQYQRAGLVAITAAAAVYAVTK